MVANGSPSYNCYTTMERNARSDLKEFNDWRYKYDKTYDGALNISQHFKAWRENRDFVENHNKKNSTFRLELNMFADNIKGTQIQPITSIWPLEHSKSLFR